MYCPCPCPFTNEAASWATAAAAAAALPPPPCNMSGIAAWGSTTVAGVAATAAVSPRRRSRPSTLARNSCSSYCCCCSSPGAARPGTATGNMATPGPASILACGTVVAADVASCVANGHGCSASVGCCKPWSAVGVGSCVVTDAALLLDAATDGSASPAAVLTTEAPADVRAWPPDVVRRATSGPKPPRNAWATASAAPPPVPAPNSCPCTTDASTPGVALLAVATAVAAVALRSPSSRPPLPCGCTSSPSISRSIWRISANSLGPAGLV